MFYRRSGEGPPLARGVTRAQSNRAEFKAVIDTGTMAGLVAYRGDEPVGWISFGPRADYRKLERSTVMKAVDDRPVWSIVCFVVPSAHRGQGVARALLDGAVAYARERNVTLEAYPLDRETRSQDAMWFGAKSMFDAAGFVEVARRKVQRPVVRKAPRGARA